MRTYMQPSKTFIFTGKHMLVLMLTFFAVILSVNILIAVIAARSWTGLVVKNSYVASQDFNKQLNDAERQAQRGWVGELSYQTKTLSFTLHEKNGDPVKLDFAEAFVGRPAYEQEDHTIKLSNVGHGVYRGATDLSPGPWQVRVVGKVGEERFRLDSRILVSNTTNEKRGDRP